VRAIFGVVSLLVALVIVGLLASRQMKTATGVSQAADSTAAASSSAPPATVREQSQQIQDKVRDDLARALEQSAPRREEADK
jgi:hypothetical protein